MNRFADNAVPAPDEDLIVSATVVLGKRVGKLTACRADNATRQMIAPD